MSQLKSDKLKRILYCDSNIDGTLGGAYFSLFYLVEGLQKEQFEPTVIFYRENTLIPTYRNAGIKTKVFNPPEPVHIKFFSESKNVFIRKFIGTVQSAINFFRFFILQAIKFAIYLKKNKIDLVHLNNSVLRSHNWMLATKLAGIKCVSHERGINVKFSGLARYFINRLDGVVCISDAVRTNLENYGFGNANLVTIYNGLDPERVTVKCPPNKIKTKFHIKKEAPLVGIVGNIKEWKGQEVVVRATAIVKKKIPGITCLIVGDTADSDRYYLERVEKVISELGIEENVIFTGYQSNVPDFMNAMDIVIHASTSGEPFGRVLLEAMALEKPLIGSRGGAVPEIIDQPQTGLMFEPGDSDGLASAILDLLEDREKAKTMGRNGKIRLVEKFHIKTNIEDTQRLYRSIFGLDN